jgi:hypothetical protein
MPLMLIRLRPWCLTSSDRCVTIPAVDLHPRHDFANLRFAASLYLLRILWSTKRPLRFRSINLYRSF